MHILRNGEFASQRDPSDRQALDPVAKQHISADMPPNICSSGRQARYADLFDHLFMNLIRGLEANIVNYSLDRRGVLDDLFQTLDWMDIKPVSGTIFGSRFTEHRVVRVKNNADITNDGKPPTRSELRAESEQVDIPTPVTGEADDASLAAGDRIVIRYLDDPRSRAECYILTERASDPRNGFLSVIIATCRGVGECVTW
jgi:hypothetical protein